MILHVSTCHQYIGKWHTYTTRDETVTVQLILFDNSQAFLTDNRRLVPIRSLIQAPYVSISALARRDKAEYDDTRSICLCEAMRESPKSTDMYAAKILVVSITQYPKKHTLRALCVTKNSSGRAKRARVKEL